MEQDAQIGYHRCQNCGRWHPEAGSYAGRFCSRECARSYRRCTVCGEYFEYNGTTLDGFCSAECAGIDASDRAEDLAEIADDATTDSNFSDEVEV